MFPWSRWACRYGRRGSFACVLPWERLRGRNAVDHRGHFSFILFANSAWGNWITQKTYLNAFYILELEQVGRVQKVDAVRVLSFFNDVISQYVPSLGPALALHCNNLSSILLGKEWMIHRSKITPQKHKVVRMKIVLQSWWSGKIKTWLYLFITSSGGGGGCQRYKDGNIILQ